MGVEEGGGEHPPVTWFNLMSERVPTTTENTVNHPVVDKNSGA
jgi:hypothetical protein